MRNKLIELVDNYTDSLSVRDLHKADFAEQFAEHLIANGMVVQQWIPVEERLPGVNEGGVLCITQYGNYKVLQWLETFKCWSDPGGIDFRNFKREYITYWMPLPECPHGGI